MYISQCRKFDPDRGGSVVLVKGGRSLQIQL